MESIPFLSLFRVSNVSRRSLDFQVKMAYQMVAISGVQVLFVLGLGVSVLHFVEGLPWVDAFYCACATVTTVGYGDRSFSTLHGRIFAVMTSIYGVYTSIRIENSNSSLYSCFFRFSGFWEVQ